MAVKKSISLTAASHANEMAVQAASHQEQVAALVHEMDVQAAVQQQQVDALAHEGTALRAQLALQQVGGYYADMIHIYNIFLYIHIYNCTGIDTCTGRCEAGC